MPIPLNNGVSTRPAIKFPNIGAAVELCVIGTRRVPWTEYGTNQPKVGNNGQERQQLVVTGLVVQVAGVLTGPQGQERVVNPGEIVDYYAHGHAWGSYIEAEKALRTAGMEPQVGDMLLVHYTHNERASQPGAQDKRVKTTTMRRARPDEGHWVTQAEAAYYSLGFNNPDGGAPAAQQAGPFDDGGQQPFQPQQPQQPQYQQPQQQPAFAPQQPQYVGQPSAPASPFGGQDNGPGF